MAITIGSKTVNGIFNDLSKEIGELFNSFSFVLSFSYDKEKFNNYVKERISNLIEKKPNAEYSDKFKNRFIEKLSEGILNYLKKKISNPKYTLRVLSNYFESSLNNAKDFRIIYACFINLDTLLDDIGFEIDSFIVLDLLEKSEIFKEIINHTTRKYKKTLESGKFREMYPSTTLELAIDCFLEKKKQKNEICEEKEENNVLMPIDHYYGLVRSLVKPFLNNNVPYEDLYQAGCLGLMEAYSKFDPSRGYMFSTCAYPNIKLYLFREIKQHSRWIYVSDGMQNQVPHFKNTRDKLAQELSREPTDGEIAASMGISERNAGYLRQISQLPRSMNYRIQGKNTKTDRESESGEFIPDPVASSRFEEGLSRADVIRGLSVLTDREKNVIILRFGLNGGKKKTLEEIGKELGVTRERVRQIEASSLETMKYFLEKGIISKAKNDQTFLNLFLNLEEKKMNDFKDYLKQHFGEEYLTIFENLINGISVSNVAKKTNNENRYVKNIKLKIISIFKVYSVGIPFHLYGDRYDLTAERVDKLFFTSLAEIEEFAEKLEKNCSNLYSSIFRLYIFGEDLREIAIKYGITMYSCKMVIDRIKRYKRTGTIKVPKEVNNVMQLMYPNGNYPDGYSEEEIREKSFIISLKLNDKEKKFIELYLAKGKNMGIIEATTEFDCPMDFLIRLQNKINDLEHCAVESNPEEVKSRFLFQRFADYSKSAIIGVIETFSHYTQTLLKKAYGENLDQSNYHNLTEHEKSRLDGIEYRIRKKLRDGQVLEGYAIKNTDIGIGDEEKGDDKMARTPQTLLERFPGHTKYELEIVISNMPIQDQILLEAAFGEKFDKVQLKSLTNTEVSRVYNLINSIRKKLKKIKNDTVSNDENLQQSQDSDEQTQGIAATNVQKEEDNKPMSAINEDVCKRILELLNDSDKAIIGVMYEFPIQHTFQEVADWLGLTEERKMSFLRNVLEACKNIGILNQVFSSIIEGSIKTYIEEITRMIQSYSTEEDKRNFCFAFRYGLIGSGVKSCEEIATFLGWKVETVISEIRKGLESFAARYFANVDLNTIDANQLLRLIR